MSSGFNDYSTFLRKRFGERMQKISIDAGFSCPNRDGKIGIEGCTFCNNESIKHSYQKQQSITQQLKKGIEIFEVKQKNNGYLAYFQYFTNTYASLEKLKKFYLEALREPKVKGLVISTRPDCIWDELLDFLEGLATNYFVSIEIGVESCNDKTLQYINRCHTYEDSVNAILKISKRNINLGVHLILGLPFETYGDCLKNAVKVSKLPIDNIKLHHLQILKHTKMAEQYENDPTIFNLFSQEEYFKLIIEIIKNIHPNVYIQRFISRAPLDLLIAPKWDGIKNFEFTHKVNKFLIDNDIKQGQDFTPS